MSLWWIGNALFLILVVPVVVVPLWVLKGSAVNVGKRIDAIHDQAGGIVIAADDVKALIPTRGAVKRVGAGLARYVKAVDRLL